MPDRTVIVPDRRRDSHDPARESFTQDRTDRTDRTRTHPRPGRADSPDAEIARFQEEVSQQQARLDRMKAHRKKALLAQAAAADAVEDAAYATELPPHYALTMFPGAYPDSSNSSRSSRWSAASHSS
jgi:hypothetical protein